MAISSWSTRTLMVKRFDEEWDRRVKDQSFFEFEQDLDFDN